MMIGAVLSTDMAHHMDMINGVTNDAKQEDYDVNNPKYRTKFIHMMFHLADISNPTK